MANEKTKEVYSRIMANHGAETTGETEKQQTGKLEQTYNRIMDNTRKRRAENGGKVTKYTSPQSQWEDDYRNLLKTVNSGRYYSDGAQKKIDSLEKSYNRLFANNPKADPIQTALTQKSFDDIRKTIRRDSTVTGIMPEEAEALRQEREQLQMQLDNFTFTDTPMFDYSGTDELKAYSELSERIADIDAKLNLYDRIDGFQDSRITPLKDQEGFATARQDFQSGNADRVAALQKQIDEYAYDWTDSNQRVQADIDLDNLENEKTDELGDYLSWWDGLNDYTKEAFLNHELMADRRNDSANQWDYMLAYDSNLDEGLRNQDTKASQHHWERMTEDEINTYYYLANTEGMAAAKAFLEDLQVTLDWRYTKSQEEADRQRLEENTSTPGAVAMGVLSVIPNVVAGPMAFASDVANEVQGKDFNPYNKWHGAQSTIGLVRNVGSEKIQEEIAGDGSSKFWNGVGEVAANAYQAGLSTLDSLAGMATMGNAYTVSMGMGAASSRMRELYESGASDQEIYWGAALSGIAEAFFEKVSLEYFTNDFIKANPEKWVKKALLQAGVEGSEEVFTELANLFIDAVNRGMNSDHNQRVRELMSDPENPLSREDAQLQAIKEDTMDVFWAFLGGAMSGGFSSIGGAVLDSSRQNQIGQDIFYRNVQGDVIAEAQELRPDDSLAATLKSKQEEGTLGKKRSDATKLGRLIEQNVADMTGKDMQAVTSAVEARLKQENMRNPEATAEAIVKSLAGEDLSLSDRYYLAINEKFADKIKSEIYSVADGRTDDNKWVREIGTYTFAPGTFGQNKTNVQKAGEEAMEKAVKENFGPYSEQIMNMYRSSQNRMDYVAEVKQMYQAGMDGVALDKAPQTKTLTEMQRQAAWDMGQGKSDYDYTNQGYATIKGETTPVNIIGVAAAGKGQLILRTDDGGTVYAKDVTFGSYSESKIYSVISLMGVDASTANEILSMSKESKLDLNEFSRAMQDAFYAGRNGIPFTDIQGDRMAMKLTREQRKMAWQAGRMAARERAIQKNKKVQQGKHLRLRDELKIENSAQSIKTLNKQQQAGMDAARVLSAMGLNITVYASTEKQRAKGMENGNIRLSDGSIRIDLNSGDSGEGVMAWALSHEFTHFVEELSPEKFQSFQELLFEELGRNGQDVAELIEEKVAVLSAQRAYENLSEDRLMEIATSEVVAEMMEPMLTDTDAISRISEKMQQQDKSLWAKIKEWITGLVEKLKNAYKDLEPGSAIARQTRSIVTQSEAILGAWTDVATDAIVNYNLQDVRQNEQAGDTRFSSRNATDEEYLKLAEKPEDNRWELEEMVFSEAERKGYLYRRNTFAEHSAVKGTPWQMFVKGLDANLVGYGDYAYVATDKGATPIEEIMPTLRSLAEEYYGTQVDDDVINPPDIVNSAGVWDDMDFVQYMWDNYFEGEVDRTGKVPAIVTEDGMLVMDIDTKRVKSAATVEYDNNGNVIPLSQRFNSGEDDIRYSSRNQITQEQNQEMESHFGTTSNYDVAGYILTDGKMLDFSGRHWGDTSSDFWQVDHRDIWEVWEHDDRDGLQEMVSLIAGGGIRLSPESGGINLSTMPNQQQISTLRGYINHFRGDVAVDIDSADGKTIQSFTYGRGVSSSKVISDLKAYFESGAVPESRESVRDFLYSARNVEQTESEQFKNWFGDWQNDPANASKVVNADGTPKVVYHQTGGLFTVFDTRREGAGSRDEGTPFGIFLKSSDRDIGLSGKFQMGLYADIKNPLRANNRENLRYQIIKMSDIYETLIAEHNQIDAEYKAKVDNSIKELREFMLEWRSENPNADRRALYDVPRFNELFEAEDNITDEWSKKIAEISSKAKEAMTEALEKNGYDGVFLAEDAGSFGRKTDAYIALHPEQVKSATDNVGAFDASNPDIRFSQRSSTQLERENEKLRRDKAYLEEVLRIQRKGNKELVPNRSSVNKVAEQLKKDTGVRGSTAELAALLDDFYRSVGKGEDDATKMQKAEAAVDWIQEHQPVQRDPYAQEVLDWLKKRHVALTQTQVDEVKYQYGSIREFQSAIKGSIIIDSESNTDLEQLWQEAAGAYPDQFDINMSEGDMPGAFADLVETLKNSKSTESQEREYYAEETRNDLLSKVYVSMANVESVESISDEMRKEIANLKRERNQAQRRTKSLEKENAMLRRDRKYLKELVEIQRKGNKDFIPDRASVTQMAEVLKKETGARGSTSELVALLDEFYRYMGKGDLNTDTMDSLVGKAADWLQAHVKEATANSEQTHKAFMDKVYDTYFTVKPAQSISEDMQKEIDALKAKRKADRAKYEEIISKETEGRRAAEKESRATMQAMQGIRKVALESYRKQQTASDQRQRQMYEQQYRMVMENYQKQLEEAGGSGKSAAKVEGWRKTEARGQLQRTLNSLNKMMLNPTKTAFVPDSLQPAVIHAMEAWNDYRLAEKPDMEQIHSLRNRLDKLILEGASKNQKEIRKINRQLDKLQGEYGSVQDMLTELQRMYGDLRAANEGKVAQIYDEGVEGFIADAVKIVGDTEYGDLSIAQLEALNDAYAAILNRVRTANKTFAYGQQQDISELAHKTGGELRRQKDRAKLTGENTGMLERFSWNNLKPEYAFERLGSQTMITLYHNLRKGEDVFYGDIADARAFCLGAMDRHGYKNWQDKVIEYESVDGKKFSLNLEERMSLYAYSRRRQAIEHLMKGGIVLTENTKRTVKGLFGIQTEKVLRDPQNYRLSLDTIQAIGDSLTKQQREFAEEMQGYLSTVCADKNNEISRVLYGVSKAKEKYYWPLKVSNLFSERIRNQQQNPGNRQKNAGHMKATTPNANNPVEVSGFMDTWGNHVNNTAMYHAFTLPMEDFMRVYNFNNTEGATEESIVQLITKKHGKAATEYIDQLLKDLNNGVRADPREGIANALTSKFKKGAVSASLSVAIQQPSAVGRAFAVIDPKYFSMADLRYYVTATVGQKAKVTEQRWEMIKKIAPVAGIKEIGRFDMNMGRSTVEFITGAGETGFMATVDKISGYLPEKMDQATWMMIYNAAERQCKAQGYKGAELTDAAGKLFTEAITKTQVYDSVFSRSGNMRSKSLFMNMATSFMAEPTTTANMFTSAMADAKKGNWKVAKRKWASIATATVLNALLASFIYAARDDDEDKPYKEKLLKSFTSELIDSANPLGYVPIVKDVWSLFQGYDIDRADMALWSEAANTLKRLESAYKAMAGLDEEDADYEEKMAAARQKVAEAWGNAAGAICNMTGLPVKNVLREIRAIVNTWETVAEGREADWETAKYSMWEALQENLPEIIRQEDGKSEELFKAMLSGSEVWVNRLKDSYGDDKKFQSAVRGCLRDHDKRIRAAAKELSENSDPTQYKKYVQDMVDEGHFTEEQIVGAIEAEAGAIKGEFTDYSAKTVDKFLDLYEDNLLDAQQFTDFWEYKNAEDENEKKLHHKEDIIVYIGKMKINSKAKDTLYLQVMKYNEDDLESTPWHSSGYTIWEAKVDHPELADAGDSATAAYLELESKEISASLFAKAWEFKYETDEDDKRLYDWKDVRDYIDTLPISDYSKDELFLALGYSEKTLKKIRWS